MEVEKTYTFREWELRTIRGSLDFLRDSLVKLLEFPPTEEEAYGARYSVAGAAGEQLRAVETIRDKIHLALTEKEDAQKARAEGTN